MLLRKRILFIAITLVALTACPTIAQTAYTFDASNSSLQISVDKQGLFSAFGHNHVVAANDFSGSVQFDPGKLDSSSVSLRVVTKSLTVVDPDASTNDRRKVQAAMLGTEVLDASRYPKIAFRSTRITQIKQRNNAWRITLTGTLRLHGTEKQVTFPLVAQLENGRLTAQGDASILQSDFGITPIAVAGGTVKVKDRLRIHFEIHAQTQK